MRTFLASLINFVIAFAAAIAIGWLAAQGF